METNKDLLIEQAVMGEIVPPAVAGGREWRISPEGTPISLPGVGGITYNCKVGETAINRKADHVEPGVSIKSEKSDANNALNILAAIGNKAQVISGDAKGDFGVVTGKHGGVEHVLIDFPQSTLDKLAIGDKVQVRAFGLGLELVDFPAVSVMNAAPDLLELIVAGVATGRLQIPVALIVPATLMGSGVGRSHVFSGDYDIQLSDSCAAGDAGLDRLRLGDIVAIEDQYHTYGRCYKKGAVSIGVVVHTLCTQSGHGPGITTVMSCASGEIETKISDNANIADLLCIGNRRAETAGGA